MKSNIFWDTTPCSPLSVNRRFGGIYLLHLQGRKNKFSKEPARKLACHGTRANAAMEIGCSDVAVPLGKYFVILLVKCFTNTPTNEICDLEMSKPRNFSRLEDSSYSFSYKLF
jgi:hypothetical protein